MHKHVDAFDGKLNHVYVARIRSVPIVTAHGEKTGSLPSGYVKIAMENGH